MAIKSYLLGFVTAAALAGLMLVTTGRVGGGATVAAVDTTPVQTPVEITPPAPPVVTFVNADLTKAQFESMMRAKGGLAGIGAFAAAQYMGTMADGFQAGAYKPEDVAVRMGGLAGGLGVNVKQLQQVVKELGDQPNEVQTLRVLISLYQSLQKQAIALRNYAQTKGDADLANFHKARSANWQILVKILGFKGEIVQKLEPTGGSLGK